MHNQILRPEQVSDRRHVGRVATDEDDAIVHAMGSGERLFEFAVDRTLSGDQPTRGGRGAIAINRSLRGLIDLGMPSQAQVVVTREISEGLPTDQRSRAGAAVVYAEERIGDTEPLRPLV